MRFPVQITRVAFGLPYLLIDLLYIGIPVVRTDGRLLGRAVHEKLKARGDPSAFSAHA